MLIPRVIPCLLLSNNGLVKTTKFAKPKYVGDPMNALKIFNDKEVDEIIFLDIDASKLGREPDYDYIKDLVSECFIPFSYGGGIKTLESIRKLLYIGVEKVIINSFAFQDKDFINKASKEFGSSTIIVAVDIKKNIWGKQRIFDASKGKFIKLEPIDYCKMVEERGAGEIFINSVDRDGTYLGFDLKLIEDISSTIDIPLIACGGASSLDDIGSVIKVGGASAASAGNLFVFQKPNKAVLISYPERKELEEIFK